MMDKAMVPRGAARAGGVRPRVALAALVMCVLAAMSVFLAPKASAADPPRFVSSFDGSGTPDGSFVPGRVAVDEASGDVYVLDLAHDVVDRFSGSGTYISQIRGSDTTSTTFMFAGSGNEDIAVDNTGGSGQGNVYVNSRELNLIFAFDSSGNELWEAPGGGRTCGVGVDPSGNVWFGDRDNIDILQLDPSDGSLTGSRITTAAGQGPCTIAFDHNGDVNVNFYHDRIDKYAPDGTFIVTISPGNNVQVGAFDVATSFLRNDVWAMVFDASGFNLRQFDSNGSLISQIRAPAPSSVPTSATVDGVHRRAFINDQGLSSVHIYDISPQAPTVTPSGATNVTKTSATLNGAVNPNGSDVTDCHFEYGTVSSRSYGSQAPCSVPLPISGQDDVPITADITGLTPGVAYHFRLVARNAGGQSDGSEVLFTTRAATPPRPVTGSASGVAQAVATVGGTVNPNGLATTCRFQYGTSTSYGSEAAATPNPGSGSSAVAVSASLAGLSAGTTYHFRLACTNSDGTVNGADATFTTAVPPTCATDASLCPPSGRTCPTDPSLCRATLKLDASVFTIKGSTATIAVSCTGDAGGTCRGTVTFRARVKTRVKRGRRTVTKTRTITVGTASYSLAVGSTGSLRIKLSLAAKKALKKSALTATADGLGSARLPKTKVRRARHRRH